MPFPGFGSAFLADIRGTPERATARVQVPLGARLPHRRCCISGFAGAGRGIAPVNFDDREFPTGMGLAVWTPLIPSTIPEEKGAAHGKSTPLGRAGQPAEQAPAFVFFASQESSYTTAEVLGVTGGHPMH